MAVRAEDTSLTFPDQYKLFPYEASINISLWVSFALISRCILSYHAKKGKYLNIRDDPELKGALQSVLRTPLSLFIGWSPQNIRTQASCTRRGETLVFAVRNE